MIISGGLPIPSIKGGAVETLIDMYINENEKIKNYDFEVYSTYCEGIEKFSKNYKYAKMSYIKTNNLSYQLDRYFRAFCHKILRLKVRFKFINEILKDIEKKNKDYDLIIVENNASLVPPLAKKYKNKVIVHLHNDNINNGIQDGVEIYNSCRRIYTVSDYIKSRCDTCGKDSDKVVTLFNGIEQNKLTQYRNEKYRKEIREKYKISDRDVVFIFSGRICDDKGVKELLMAFNKIKRISNNKDVKLMIVGASFFSAKKKTRYIKELINLAKENEKDIIFTGYIEYKNMGKIYNAADVQVIPSKFDDPCPLTALEGMTMGLPQIASRCGGIPEEVSDENAILVEREDLINQLAEAMNKLIIDENLRKKMSKASTERAKLFGEQQYVDNFYKLIEKEFEEEV